jgi:hypothetical protein
MQHRPLWAGILALLACAALAPALAGQGRQARQRSIYVSVLDQHGVPATDLRPSDFIVKEDKVAREVLSLTPATEPMQLALLVDDSQAAEEFIPHYREALPLFVNTIMTDDGPKHQVALITVGERPTIVTEYTSNREAVLKGIERIYARRGSGTYLLDGLVETTRGLVKRGATRPVIVAVTTEGPEYSNRSYDQVLTPLRDSGTAFHVLAVGRPINTDSERAIVFGRGTRDQGGRYENVLIGNGLRVRLQQVAVDLTHQYLVTYARPESLIPPDTLSVSVTRPGLTARGPETQQRQGQR